MYVYIDAQTFVVTDRMRGSNTRLEQKEDCVSACLSSPQVTTLLLPLNAANAGSVEEMLCTLTSDEDTEDESPPEDAPPQVTTLPLPLNAANALAVE